MTRKTHAAPADSADSLDIHAVDTPEEADHARATYDASKYERPSVTADVIILTMRERRLMKAVLVP